MASQSNSVRVVRLWARTCQVTVADVPAGTLERAPHLPGISHPWTAYAGSGPSRTCRGAARTAPLALALLVNG